MPKRKAADFANFSSSDQGASARSLHRQNALLYRWKFGLKSSGCKIQKSDHTKTSDHTTESTRKSGSPMLLIQANKGQKSKLVNSEIRSIRSGLLARRFMEKNVYSLSKKKNEAQTLVTLSPSQGVYVICVKSVERTENCTWPLSCVTFISRSIHSLIANSVVSMVLMRMMRIHPS